MMGGQGTSRFRNNIRLRNIVLHTSIHQCRNRVVYIFLYRIVHTALARRRASPVIIDSQSASDIDKIDIETHIMKLYIKLRSLAQSIFYTTDFGNLATYMKMYQMQTILHFILFQNIQCFKQFAGIKAEFTDITS